MRAAFRLLLALAQVFALAGCVTNGNGLIGTGGGVSSGSITIIEPGHAPRTVTIR